MRGILVPQGPADFTMAAKHALAKLDTNPGSSIPLYTLK